MKFLKLTILLAIIGLAVLTAHQVQAATEFTSIIDPDNGVGTDYTSLAAWEQAVQADLTATTTTLVFPYNPGTASGTIPDGWTVIGETSGATGTAAHMTGTTSPATSQIMIKDIANGAFQNGEKIYLQATSSIFVYASSSGDMVIAVAKCRSTGGSADTSVVTIDGWTTASTTYIKIWTDPDDAYGRHQGKWDTNKYRLVGDPVADGMIDIKVGYVKINGLQIGFSNSRSYKGLISLNVGSTVIEISHCMLNGANNGWQNAGVYAQWSQTNFTAKVFNNMIYDFDTSADAGIRFQGTNNTMYAYNNTIHNCSRGYYRDAGSFIAKNNIAQDCANGFDGNFNSASDYNISDIAGDAPNATFSTAAINVEFLDETNDDFHLMPESQGVNAGVDLSSDANLAFSDDIDGQSRYDTAWDIGADEAPTILYRSVGNDTRDLNTGSATTTIATTTALFSADLPANIGVGDVLEYGSPLQLGFIMSRTSSSSYEIQSRTGALPAATTSAAVSVFRAHEFLDDWEDQEIADVNDGIDESVDELVLMPSMDLVGSNTAMFVPAYASTSEDNLAVDIDGWTTGTSSYIKIYTPVGSAEAGESQRHSGAWDDNKYRIELTSSSNNFYALNIEDNFTRVSGLQIYLTANNFDDNAGLRADNIAAGNDIRLTHNIVKANLTGTTEAMGINIADTDVIGQYYNNIIYSFINGAEPCYGIYINGTTTLIYNNTIYDCETGLRNFDSSALIKNNAIFNNNNDFFSATGTLGYNASDDGDGTNAIDISASGFASEADGWNAAFTNYASYDFSIRNTASVLYDAGTTITIVNDDIIGTVRPYFDAYDIGAFEFAGSRAKYRFSPGGTFKLKGEFRFK